MLWWKKVYTEYFNHATLVSIYMEWLLVAIHCLTLFFLKDEISTVTPNSTSRYIVGGSASGSVKIWDLKNKSLKKTYEVVIFLRFVFLSTSTCVPFLSPASSSESDVTEVQLEGFAYCIRKWEWRDHPQQCRVWSRVSTSRVSQITSSCTFTQYSVHKYYCWT